MKAFAAHAKSQHGGSKFPQKGGGGGAPPGKNGGGGNQPQKRDAKTIAQQIAQQIDAGKVDGQLRKLMRGYDPEDGYPQWAKDESKWEEAERAVQPNGRGNGRSGDPWLLVAHVYKGLGGRVVPGAQPDDGDSRGGGEDAAGEEESSKNEAPKKQPPPKGKKSPPPQKDDDDEDDDEDDGEPDGDEEGGEARGDHPEPDGDEPDGDGDDEDLEDMVEAAARAVEDGEDEEAERLGREHPGGDDPPDWVGNVDVWHRARAAVDPEGKGADLYDSPWAVVVALYRAMGGQVKDRDGQEKGDHEDE
jgi:hypothetical protein